MVKGDQKRRWVGKERGKKRECKAEEINIKYKITSFEQLIIDLLITLLFCQNCYDRGATAAAVV